VLSEIEKPVEEKMTSTQSKGRLLIRFDPDEDYGSIKKTLEDEVADLIRSKIEEIIPEVK